MPQHPDYNTPNVDSLSRGAGQSGQMAPSGETLAPRRTLYRSFPKSDPETVTALLNRLETITTERDTMRRIIMDAEKELNLNARTIADLNELNRLKDKAMASDQQTIATLEKQVHDLQAKLNPAGKAKKPKRKR